MKTYDYKQLHFDREMNEMGREAVKAHPELVASTQGASAPELHEALQNLLTEFDAYEEAMCRRFGAGHEDYGRQRELARLALAKADGGGGGSMSEKSAGVVPTWIVNLKTYNT